MIENSTILVVAAHPDDEVLGCGGTIARHTEAGDRVHLLFLADGVSSRTERPDRAAVQRRQATAAAAARELGADPPRFFGGPDNALDSLALIEVVRAVEAVVSDVAPDIVYTHHGGDLNIDHGVACRAVLTACRPLPGSPVRAIYAFEVPSSTDWSMPSIGPNFQPQRFVDVTDTMVRKRRALAAYADEMREFPHSRSVDALDALARWRGSTAGFQAAEAFEILREIV